MTEKEIAYEGLMYRKMTEIIENASYSFNENIAFVGFNALNKCEEKLLQYMQNNTTSHFFWDYDVYYSDSNNHEASLFVNKNLSSFPMPNDFNVNFNNFCQLKEIDVVSIPGFAGQSTYAAKWLEENKNIVNSNFDNTALVLCDETLLLPMLNSIPEYIPDLNITMGFPIKSSPAYALLKALVDLDRNSRKDKSGKWIFYYKNILDLV